MKFTQLSYVLFISLSVLGQGRNSESSAIRHSPAFPSLDSSIIQGWPRSNYYAEVSPDGKYASFITFYPSNEKDLVVKNDLGDSLLTVSSSRLDLGIHYFSKDSKKIVFKNNDSICVYDLRKHITIRKLNDSGLSMPNNYKGEWIFYFEESASLRLSILSLVTDEAFVIDNVRNYYVDHYGKFVVVMLKDPSDGSNKVCWVDLKSRRINEFLKLSEDVSITEFKVDLGNRQVSFITKGSHGFSVYTYSPHLVSAKKVADERGFRSLEDTDATRVLSNLEFNRDGNWVFFDVITVLQLPKPIPNKSKLSVWNYRDAEIQPEQIRQVSLAKNGDQQNVVQKFVVSIDGLSNAIEMTNSLTSSSLAPNEIATDFTILREKRFPNVVFNFEKNYFLFSFRDGRKRAIDLKSRDVSHFYVTPDGQNVIYWNYDSTQYFIFDVGKRIATSLTKKINTSFVQELDSLERFYLGPVEAIAGWCAHDSSVLIYDNYDIWKVKTKYPYNHANITHFFGKRNAIKLRLISAHDLWEETYSYGRDETLMLTGFNQYTKENGLFSVNLNGKGDVKELVYGKFNFYKTISQIGGYFFANLGMKPIKAKSSNTWILSRESDVEMPNYILTRDFKTFINLSKLNDVQGQSWIQSELLTWKNIDGRYNQGILYKPTNFDSTRKYPLIIHYYSKLSHRIYEFNYPNFCEFEIDVPLFVKNGYLVFICDINYSIAARSGVTLGENVFNSVTSGLNHIQQKGYIDTLSVGLQGHSFGGLETSILITKSRKRFAAAAEFAGSTDPVSRYLTLSPFATNRTTMLEHSELQQNIERGHESYGASLWEIPELYLRNSAVLNADKIATPLLIVHNPKDNQVNFRQGVEMYMSLRRLQKPCWMLSYDDGSHVLRGRDAVDFTVRLFQFFNHYLKKYPAPIWMTEGVPAVLRQRITGYDYDFNGSCSPACEICRKYTIGN